MKAAGLALLALAAACGSDPPEEPAARRVSVTGVGFDARGMSRPVQVTVPERTRSLAIVVRGAPGALYGLASLVTADGVEQVGLPGGIDLAAAMRTAYFDEEVGLMPGALRQSLRLGLFTQIVPDRPGRPLAAGEVTLRVATTDPASTVDVEVLAPEEDGAHRLPITVFSVSGAAGAEDAAALPFLPALERILAGGGVDVEIERVVELPASDVARMTVASRPQESPDSASSQLALLGGAMVSDSSLAVYLVDSLPGGVAGLSLGTPGPPLPDTCYSGVVVARQGSAAERGRVLAHEIAHYLGLVHVEDPGRSGRRYPDPLDDTETGTGNLMDGGRRLTPDQAFVLSRSPLLR